MTCPTTAAFNGLVGKRTLNVAVVCDISAMVSKRKAMVGGRKCWKIPVMEGNFYVEDGFGAMEAVAGGNFMIFAKTQAEGLVAAEAAAERDPREMPRRNNAVPGGVCRSGSKAGSLKYKMKASTNHTYCPTIRALVPDTVVPEGVDAVYEDSHERLDVDSGERSHEGVLAAIACPGVQLN